MAHSDRDRENKMGWKWNGEDQINPVNCDQYIPLSKPIVEQPQGTVV